MISFCFFSILFDENPHGGGLEETNIAYDCGVPLRTHKTGFIKLHFFGNYGVLSLC